MKSDLTKITLEAGPEGQEVDFFVLEQTRIAGRDYLLVTDAEDGDGDAYILEDISADGERDALYEFVEDDERLEALSKVFTQMLDDIALV
ncbi:MAG: DUF1292 domain-containing protein [Lachnospiraceae bacterium]|jgi:hypothetical protein|nr:DUF1292 domain-containing protein [Lachnospiraceae bacterium]